MGSITLSKLNPIRFFATRAELIENTRYIGQRYTYFHEWQTDDRLRMQVITPTGYNNSGIVLRFQDRESGKEYTINPSLTDNIGAIIIWGFDYKLDEYPGGGVPEGCYNLRLEITDATETYITYLYADPIYLLDEHIDTVLIEYYDNSPQKFDSFFVDYNSFSYFIRMKGGMAPGTLTFSSEDEVYLSQQADAFTLSSEPYKVDKLTAGDTMGIPDYIAEILNYAISLSNFIVDGVRYSKNEGATWQRVEQDRLLSPWTCELLLSDNASSNVFDEIPILGSFDDSFDFSFEKYN